MVGEGCGRQILKGEHYFYLERSPKQWYPFTSDYPSTDPMRRCQNYNEKGNFAKDVIARRCHECAVRLGIVW